MGFILIFTTLFFLISLGHCGVEELWTRKKCIEDLGCFSAGEPFFNFLERPVSLLPDNRDTIDTKFFLFTPHNGAAYANFSNLDFSIDDLSSSGFDPRLGTKFIIPGFMSQFAAYWKLPMIESLIGAKGCNVFLVDWHGGEGPIYEQAVANTRVVGAEIAYFIKQIQQRTGISLKSIHLIGHSLGSHIAGYAGKRLNKIGRITALDPAGPYFTNVDPIVRLDKSDALFVDAIHTNAAPSRFQGFGLTNSVAHFDFWPNGGHLQPGCPNMDPSIWDFLTNPTLDYDDIHDITCNHDRAIHLFLSSINHPNCELLGMACDTWDDYVERRCEKDKDNQAKFFLMGLNADESKRYIDNSRSLNIFLSTTDVEPFCKK